MKFRTFFGGLLWLTAIIISLFAIFRIIPNIEIAIGFVTISFGILAVIWTSIARYNLSAGSALRNYTTYFLCCLIFILLFSIWHTFGIIFSWEGLILIPKYIFITIAYLIFSYTSYQIWLIGKEFGFKNEAATINRIMQEKKRHKSRIRRK